MEAVRTHTETFVPVNPESKAPEGGEMYPGGPWLCRFAGDRPLVYANASGFSVSKGEESPRGKLFVFQTVVVGENVIEQTKGFRKKYEKESSGTEVRA